MIEQAIVDELDAAARLAEGWLVKMALPSGKLLIERPKQANVPDLEAKDIVNPSSVFDEPSEDEILYWAVGYYDVLDHNKKQRSEQLKLERETKNG